jgi:predicted RNA-binding Zn-ribbon protein involved in translation (DUF1610 family)
MKKRSQQPSVNYPLQGEAVESKVTATVDVPITQATGANLRAQIESWLLKDIADRHVPVQLAGFQVQDIMFNRATVSVTYTGNEAEVTEYIQQLGAPITNVGSKKVAIKGHVCDNCSRSLSEDAYVGPGSWSYKCPKCGFKYIHGSNLTAEEQVKKFNNEGQFETTSSQKKSWRQTLGATETPNKGFKPYKGDTQTFPGSAEFKGDEFPSKGDPAKKELGAWKEGNRLMQSDKKSDDSQTEHGSPLMSEKIKRYDVLKHNKEEHVLPKYAGKKSFWRKVLSFGFGGDTGIDADVSAPKYDYVGEPVSYHGRAGVVDLPEDEFGMVEVRFDDTGEVEAVDANELREQEFGEAPEILGPISSQKVAEDIHIVKCPNCGYAGNEEEFLPPNTPPEAADFYTCPSCQQDMPLDADSTYPFEEDDALFSSKKSWREKLAYISKEDSGYTVRSETGKKLRKHPTTKEKAKKQLQAIEINKYKRGSKEEDTYPFSITSGPGEEHQIYNEETGDMEYVGRGKEAERKAKEIIQRKLHRRRAFLQQKADISFQNRPDGTVKIDVTSHPNEPLTQNPNTQQPPPMSPEQVQNQQVEETSEKKSTLKKKIASEDYEALAKDYGVIFKGIQKDLRNPTAPGFPMFEDPATKSTFLLRPDETLPHAIVRSQSAFSLHPKNKLTSSAAFEKALADLHVVGEDLQRKESSCSDNPIESWVIRKDGNLALIGKQCNTHCGIFIEKDGKVIKENKLEKTANNLTWRELINQAEWEVEYEKYLNQEGT